MHPARAPSVRAPSLNRAALPFRTAERTISCALLRIAAGFHDRGKNFRIARAAAKISGKPFANVRLGWPRVARQKIHGSENHSGRADATLRPAVHEKGLLDGVQPRVVGDAFDRADLRALRLQRRHQAALYQRSVDLDPPSPALA